MSSRERRDAGDKAYYRLPDMPWNDVDPDVLAGARRLAEQVLVTLGPAAPEEDGASAGRGSQPAGMITPVQAALRMYELANRMWQEAAGEERELRQVITTLRTALAVCWDLYSPAEAERTSVSQMMRALRDRIEDFERDLSTYPLDDAAPNQPEG